MTTILQSRRAFIATAAAAGVALAAPALMRPAHAQLALAPTRTMRGGANNYRPGAPFVETLGQGFVMSGLVRRATDGAALRNVRIQIWAATVLGGERDPVNHGSVLTGADGTYRLTMPQIVPNFGQPHGHLAYDDDDFETVFLRPVMPSASDTSLRADFVLMPA